MSDTRTAILAADDARYAAMIEGDFTALEEILADELLYGHSSGQVDTRESYLNALRGGAVKYLEVQRSVETVSEVGPVALMTGLHRLRVQVGGQERVLHNRFMTTWVQRGGSWLLLSWASTPLSASA